MARIKQKLNFEGLTSATDQTPFLNNTYGFTWTGLRAYDNANLPAGQDPVATANGSGFAYNGGFGQRSTMYRDTDFSLRKLSLTDVGANDVGESVLIRGFLDNREVIQFFTFLDGTPNPSTVRLPKEFKNVDFVDFIWGSFGSVSASIDAIQVKVQAPVATSFESDAALL